MLPDCDERFDYAWMFFLEDYLLGAVNKAETASLRCHCNDCERRLL